jgi:hypothetical protein
MIFLTLARELRTPKIVPVSLRLKKLLTEAVFSGLVVNGQVAEVMFDASMESGQSDEYRLVKIVFTIPLADAAADAIMAQGKLRQLA